MIEDLLDDEPTASNPRMSIELDGQVRITTPGGGANVLENGMLHSTLTEVPPEWAAEAEELEALGIDLHNVPEASVLLKKENFRHRLVFIMKCRGDLNRAIARKLKYSETQVSIITRQPWFRKALLLHYERMGKDAVTEVLQTEGMNALWKVVEMSQTASSETVKQNCCFNLMDRWLGKPVQRTENVTPKREESLDELDAKIAEVQEAIAAKQGPAVPPLPG